MDTLTSAFRELPEHELPTDLHDRIMRKLFYRRLRAPFFALASLLALNLGLSAWHAWARIVDLESVSIVTAMFEGFEVSADFFGMFARNLYEFLPVSAILIFFLNTALAGYLVYLYRRLMTVPISKGRPISVS